MVEKGDLGTGRLAGFWHRIAFTVEKDKSLVGSKDAVDSSVLRKSCQKSVQVAGLELFLGFNARMATRTAGCLSVVTAVIFQEEISSKQKKPNSFELGFFFFAVGGMFLIRLNTSTCYQRVKGHLIVCCWNLAPLSRRRPLSHHFQHHRSLLLRLIQLQVLLLLR